MRRYLIAFLLGVVFLSTGCAPKTLSPTAQVAYNADQIVIRLGEAQNVILQACHAGTGPTCAPDAPISTAASRTLVQVIVTATQALKASPDGWQASVKAAWDQAKMAPELQTSNVQGYVLALNTLLGVD